MSDNDLISRMALYEKTAEWEAQALHMAELHLHDDDKAEWRKWSTVLTERSAFKQDVADAPAVPHEMTAREYLTAEQRMCFDENVGKRNCLTCPLSSRINPARINCGDYTRQHPEEAVAIVKRWAREHPEGARNESMPSH